jgi:hypothetical protein
MSLEAPASHDQFHIPDLSGPPGPVFLCPGCTGTQKNPGVAPRGRSRIPESRLLHARTVILSEPGTQLIGWVPGESKDLPKPAARFTHFCGASVPPARIPRARNGGTEPRAAGTPAPQTLPGAGKPRRGDRCLAWGVSPRNRTKSHFVSPEGATEKWDDYFSASSFSSNTWKRG